LIFVTQLNVPSFLGMSVVGGGGIRIIEGFPRVVEDVCDLVDDEDG